MKEVENPQNNNCGRKKKETKKNVEKKEVKKKKSCKMECPQVNDFLMIPNVLIHS